MIEGLKTKDLFAKIAAIVLALLVWVQVINEQNPMQTRSLNLSLEFMVPSDRVVMSASADRVQVTLEGRANTLNSISPEEFTIPIDLSQVGLGEQSVSVTFEPPEGVHIVDVNPSSVMVDTDIIETRTVSVSIHTRGVPHEDYEVGRPSTSDETVKVMGPKRQVDTVQWAVGEIDVGGATKEVVAMVALSPRDSLSNIPSRVTVDPKEIAVNVPLISRPPAKTVPVHVETKGEPKEGYRLEGTNPRPQFVRIRAPEDVIGQVNALTTRSIEINGRDSTFTYTATLNVPSGVAWIETTQVNVTVNIVEDVIEKTFSDIIVTPKDPMPGLKFTVTPPQVDVVLRGRRDIISKLRPADIEAYVDARDRQPGEYQLRVALTLPQNVDINISDISPMYVTLVLEER
jgi:YbbR domain-containing protein